jgi:hypothetical protein
MLRLRFYRAGEEIRTALNFSSKDIRYFEKWADGLSRLDFLDPLLVKSAQNTVRSLREGLKGDSMDKDVDELNKMADRLWDRSPAPKLTPEQLNAIDLLILGKTEKEVSETIGVRRETVSRWHKNAFFIAELNIKRETLWVDSKLRLKALASEAVDVLTNGLHSSDEKIAITAAVHILKVTGLYDKEGKCSINLPKTPEEAVWAQMVQDKTRLYRGVRPDSFTDWSTKQWTEQVGKNLTIKWIDSEYECAVDEQKRELKEFKKKEKAQAQLPKIEPIPLIVEDIEEDLPQDQGDRREAIKA